MKFNEAVENLDKRFKDGMKKAEITLEEFKAIRDFNRYGYDVYNFLVENENEQDKEKKNE